MKVVFKDTFVVRLEKQIEYISLDSPERARKFKNELIKKIKEIPKRPMSFWKSIYFDNEMIRDLIFKGYTIVFRVSDSRIEVFGFVKYQQSVNDR